MANRLWQQNCYSNVCKVRELQTCPLDRTVSFETRLLVWHNMHFLNFKVYFFNTDFLTNTETTKMGERFGLSSLASILLWLYV